MTQHRRNLHELAGQLDPKSGLEVRAYEKPIDFEFQVEQHLRAHVAQLPHRPEWSHNLKAVERHIRRDLAIGAAWLFPEPQMELFAA